MREKSWGDERRDERGTDTAVGSKYLLKKV